MTLDLHERRLADNTIAMMTELGMNRIAFDNLANMVIYGLVQTNLAYLFANPATIKEIYDYLLSSLPALAVVEDDASAPVSCETQPLPGGVAGASRQRGRRKG